MKNGSKIIGITQGDPGGIGPEVVLKALRKYLPLQKKGTYFLVLGHLAVFEKNAELLGFKGSFNRIDRLDPKLLVPGDINLLEPGLLRPFRVGGVDPQNGCLAFETIRLGAYLADRGLISSLMTAPVCKEAIKLTLPKFIGHTEYLAEVSHVKTVVMMLQGGPLRVIPVTTHVALKEVPKILTSRIIIEKTKIVYDHFKQKLGRVPRIGIAGLNPHAGEGALMGTEEKNIISPAVKRLKMKGMEVLGPIPADTIFRKAYTGKLDAVMAMYHDQGLGPLKMIAFEDGINVTLGLPYRRSSPDHGTAFDIAYKGAASSVSTQKAIEYLL